MAGMFLTFFIILFRLPQEVNLVNVFDVAKIEGKLELLNFSTDLNERYTVWSGLTAGFFLMLAYFGTDQSQVEIFVGKKHQRNANGLVDEWCFESPDAVFYLVGWGDGVYLFPFLSGSAAFQSGKY